MTDNAPKLHTVPTVSDIIQNAVNEDTNRATRMMSEQLQKIVTGLENEMREAQKVRDTITKRIIDLHAAANAARASLEALNNYGS